MMDARARPSAWQQGGAAVLVFFAVRRIHHFVLLAVDHDNAFDSQNAQQSLKFNSATFL